MRSTECPSSCDFYRSMLCIARTYTRPTGVSLSDLTKCSMTCSKTSDKGGGKCVCPRLSGQVCLSVLKRLTGLVKCSMTCSIARPLCDCWASCFREWRRWSARFIKIWLHESVPVTHYYMWIKISALCYMSTTPFHRYSQYSTALLRIYH